MRSRLLIATVTLTAILQSAPTTRATLSGKVTDSSGHLLENATVMIYQAGVKKGYSIYCPSCYVDCGKRATTDKTGAFSFTNLDPDLWFNLLVIRDGYNATFVNKVDPAQQPVATAALHQRTPVNDPARLVRGRIVDPTGQPMRAAVVMPKGIEIDTAQGRMSQYGTVDGLEPIAVTNDRGEFELAHSDKAIGMLLEVEARGMATKLVAATTGPDRKTITVSDGAIVRGRLVNRGKPVAGAELGLSARERGGYGANLKIIGNPYDEIRIGTQPDGTFVITNVPASVDWYVYGKMESIASLGATPPLEFSTRRDKEEVNLGDIEIRPGHKLAGKVMLSDGTTIPDGMRIRINARNAWDSQSVIIGRDGRFEFQGIPAGSYDIVPSVRGYSSQNDDDLIATTIDRDRDDLAIKLAPAARR